MKNMEIIRELYNTRMQYNCGYEMATSHGEVYVIVFIGTDCFVIMNHYDGAVAYGVRSYDWDSNSATYTGAMFPEKVRFSSIERVITKYERNRLKTSATIKIQMQKE